MPFISFNGSHLPSGQPLLSADNRGFKYGDGFFETIKVLNGSIELMKYHFDRIVKSASILKMDIRHLEKQFLINDILELCKKNNCPGSSRVRVAFFRSEIDKAEFIVEAIPYKNDKKPNFSIDLFPEVQKPIDILSNLKTANYLPYVMASLYAQRNSLDDALITNVKGNICDSSKANVFIIKDGTILTPALNEGCVDGTMRKYLINKMEELNIKIIESKVDLDQLLQADEVFLTNAIIGIQSVTTCKQRSFSVSITEKINRKIFQPFDQLFVD